MAPPVTQDSAPFAIRRLRAKDDNTPGAWPDTYRGTDYGTVLGLDIKAPKYTSAVRAA